MNDARGQRKVLLVEDDPDIARLVETHLRDLNCHLTVATTGRLGRELATGAGSWDLLILDWMLPDLDGLEICRAVREQEQADYTAILMLTARSAELDRILGLESGADDYVTKPFSILELVARVKAIFRRGEALSGDKLEKLQLGGLLVDQETRSVTLRGQAVELTAREFDLLAHFARYPGRVFRRAELLDAVWGYKHDGYEHTVNSHINRLRAKIETESSKPEIVLTVWGVGYKLDPAGVPASEDAP